MRTMVKRTCKKCGKKFLIAKSLTNFGFGKYCSKKCQIDARTTRVLVVCKICGKKFFVQPHRFKNGRGVYCSRECQCKSMVKLVEIVCRQCGKKFYRKPSGKTEYCSRKCSGEAIRGKNHPMYVSERKVRDYGVNWPHQRKLAIERDRYKCAICGKTKEQLPDKTLHVHHKVRRRFFTDENAANDLGNLITLCIGCHRKAENGRIVLT